MDSQKEIKEIISDPSEMKEFLREWSWEHPRWVVKDLSRGDVIKKRGGLSYVIDNSKIYESLGSSPSEEDFYKKIYNHFKATEFNGENFFRDEGIESQIPFSMVFKSGIGGALERAILLKIATQEKQDSFLIPSGLVRNGFGNYKENFYPYNITFKDGKPFLIDLSTPLLFKSNFDKNYYYYHPYIAPIKGIANPEMVSVRTFDTFSKKAELEGKTELSKSPKFIVDLQKPERYPREYRFFNIFVDVSSRRNFNR